MIKALNKDDNQSTNHKEFMEIISKGESAFEIKIGTNFRNMINEVYKNNAILNQFKGIQTRSLLLYFFSNLSLKSWEMIDIKLNRIEKRMLTFYNPIETKRRALRQRAAGNGRRQKKTVRKHQQQAEDSDSLSIVATPPMRIIGDDIDSDSPGQLLQKMSSGPRIRLDDVEGLSQPQRIENRSQSGSGKQQNLKRDELITQNIYFFDSPDNSQNRQDAESNDGADLSMVPNMEIDNSESPFHKKISVQAQRMVEEALEDQYQNNRNRTAKRRVRNVQTSTKNKKFIRQYYKVDQDITNSKLRFEDERTRDRTKFFTTTHRKMTSNIKWNSQKHANYLNYTLRSFQAPLQNFKKDVTFRMDVILGYQKSFLAMSVGNNNGIQQIAGSSQNSSLKSNSLNRNIHIKHLDHSQQNGYINQDHSQVDDSNDNLPHFGNANYHISEVNQDQEQQNQVNRKPKSNQFNSMGNRDLKPTTFQMNCIKQIVDKQLGFKQYCQRKKLKKQQTAELFYSLLIASKQGLHIQQREPHKFSEIKVYKINA